MPIDAERLQYFIIVVIVENPTNIEGVTVITNLLQTLVTFEVPNLKEVLNECSNSNEYMAFFYQSKEYFLTLKNTLFDLASIIVL